MADKSLVIKRCLPITLYGISFGFPKLFPSHRQVTHVLLTRSPLIHKCFVQVLRSRFIVRLACVRHAASVHPEPGSNSQFKFLKLRADSALYYLLILKYFASQKL